MFHAEFVSHSREVHRQWSVCQRCCCSGLLLLLLLLLLLFCFVFVFGFPQCKNLRIRVNSIRCRMASQVLTDSRRRPPGRNDAARANRLYRATRVPPSSRCWPGPPRGRSAVNPAPRPPCFLQTLNSSTPTPSDPPPRPNHSPLRPYRHPYLPAPARGRD